MLYSVCPPPPPCMLCTGRAPLCVKARGVVAVRDAPAGGRSMYVVFLERCSFMFVVYRVGRPCVLYLGVWLQSRDAPLGELRWAFLYVVFPERRPFMFAVYRVGRPFLHVVSRVGRPCVLYLGVWLQLEMLRSRCRIVLITQHDDEDTNNTHVTLICASVTYRMWIRAD